MWADAKRLCCGDHHRGVQCIPSLTVSQQMYCWKISRNLFSMKFVNSPKQQFLGTLRMIRNEIVDWAFFSNSDEAKISLMGEIIHLEFLLWMKTSSAVETFNRSNILFSTEINRIPFQLKWIVYPRPKAGNDHFNFEGENITHWFDHLPRQDFLIRNQLHICMRQFYSCSR